MNQALQVAENFSDRQLTAPQMVSHVRLVQEVMRDVMKQDVHYGVIPGSKKPSLLKPGAEVLRVTFRIAISYHQEDLSGPDFVRYRVRAICTHFPTGTILSEGFGECSSNEEKYKWKRASSVREFESTPEAQRRIKFGYDKYSKKEYEIRQVRMEPADIANTILKMACKRADVMATINATASSDIFSQDLEDLPEGYIAEDVAEKPAIQQPQERKEAEAKQPPKARLPISASALKLLRAVAKTQNVSETDVCLRFKVGTMEELFIDQVNEAQDFIKGKTQ